MQNKNLFWDNPKKLYFYSAVKFANCFDISILFDYPNGYIKTKSGAFFKKPYLNEH